MSFSEIFLHWFHPRRSNNHRPKVLHPRMITGLTLVVLGLAVVSQPIKMVVNKTGSVLGYASNISAGDVITQVNQQRQQLGESALRINPLLNQAAQAKAQHMFSKQYWAHVSPDGTQPWFFFKQVQYQYSIAGENLARDFSNTPDMVQAWMNSPTHKENILNGRYQDTGVAVVNGTLLGTQTTLVVQLFGTPQQTAPAVTAKAAKVTSPVAEAAPTQQITILTEPTSGVQGDQTQTLGATVLPITTLSAPPLFSPLQLMKAFFLAIIFMLSSTLFYDWVIMGNSNTVRMVGKNFAHILLLLTVAFLLVFFKGGIIG